MSIIHILDKNTDALVGFLTNEGDDLYWDDFYERDLRTLEGTAGFTMPSTIAEASKVGHRSRFVINVRGKYREYLVFEENTSIENQKEVIGTETYMDLDKQFILPPGTYTGTLLEHLQLVLPDTEFDIGVVEYSGIRTLQIDDYIGAYSYIQRLLTAFDAEVDFRIEITGNQLTGRYIDAVQRVGEVTEKEIEIGKDLIDVEMRVYSDRVVTALECKGPEREDGTRLETFVSDADAFQRWNLNGKHLVGVYSPQSENADMTLEQLQQYGRTELNKRIAAVVEYRVTATKLREIHEQVNLGDTVRIKNPRFVPALYANARIVREEGSIADDSVGSYEIGEVVLYDVDEINARLNAFRERYNLKLAQLTASKNAVHKQPTKPDVTIAVQGDTWINTAEGNKIYNFETATNDYEPSELEPEALNVMMVSDVADNLGDIIAGNITGVNIEGSRFYSTISNEDYKWETESIAGRNTLTRLDVATEEVISHSEMQGGSWYVVDWDALVSMAMNIAAFGSRQFQMQSIDPSNRSVASIGPRDFSITHGKSLDDFTSLQTGQTRIRLQMGTTGQPSLIGSKHSGVSAFQFLISGFTSMLLDTPLLTTQVETGFCGFQASRGNIPVVGSVGVNFRIKKNYVPSSITFSQTGGNGTVNFNELTNDGFLLIVTAPAGTVLGDLVGWRGTYTA